MASVVRALDVIDGESGRNFPELQRALNSLSTFESEIDEVFGRYLSLVGHWRPLE